MSRLLLRQRMLLIARWPNVRQPAGLRRADLGKVAASGGEAQTTVRAATDAIGVVGVLPVVLPEAHGADFPPAALVKREVSTARAGIRTVAAPDDVDEGAFHASDRRRKARR
jgi:hypothetical protein